MGVLKPLRRMVSLRLSEQEYQELVELTTRRGAHSTSDMARIAICTFLENCGTPAPPHGLDGRDLVSKLAQLEGEVQRLSQILDSKAAAASAGPKG